MMATGPPPAPVRPDRRLTGLLLAMGALALAALPRILSPAPGIDVLGPLASAVLWLPVTLWLAAALLDPSHPRGTWTLCLLARSSLWLLFVLVLVDPVPNLPDHITAAVGGLLDEATEGARAAIAGVAGALVIGFLVVVLAGGSSRPPASTPERVIVRTGSGLHPVIGVLGRLAMRLLARAALALLRTALALVAWTLYGLAGLRSARGGSTAPTRATAAVAALHGRVTLDGLRVLGAIWRASDGWGRRTPHGVWERPASVLRDEAGLRVERPWSRALATTPDDAELIELGAILDAYDVALMAAASRPPGNGPGSVAGPNQAPRPYPYELRIERAWSRPEYHALVITAEPAAAGAAMAKVTAAQLASALDPLTRWTADELTAMLRLSDRRVALDELRAGATGLFVGVDRVGETAPDTSSEPPDPLRAAVERALREASLGHRFRYHATEESEDGSTVVEVRASFATGLEFTELQKQWANLESAVSVHARAQVRLTSRLDPYGFLATLPPPPGQGWPAGDATDWARVIPTMPVAARHPSRVVLGLDRRANPVTLDLAGETSHLLVGSATGMGKTNLVQGLVASLLWADLRMAERTHGAWPPTELVIVESIKRDVTARFGPAAVECIAVTDGDEVVAAIEGFRAEMERRYRDLAGRPFEPVRMGRRILVLEEFGSLRLSLERGQDERIVRALTAIANTGRGVACSVICLVQKATAATVPPSAKASMTRLAGWYPQASDMGVVLDHPKRNLLPRVPGRMAMQTADGITIFQALRITDAAIDGVVRDWVRVFRGPPGPTTLPPTESDDPLPRAPGAAEVARLDALTVARILYRWQARADALVTVSVRGVIAHVRDDLGMTPGRIEGWTSALAELEDLGILAAVGDHPTAARRLAVADWPTARARILRGTGRT